jgi:hypothetical protein
MAATIATAASYIEDLLAALDDAYWEASTIENKDLIYSIIALLQQERTDSAKLSVQDHNFLYEPITDGSKMLGGKLHYLQNSLNTIVLRGQTARALVPLVANVFTLLT